MTSRREFLTSVLAVGAAGFPDRGTRRLMARGYIPRVFPPPGTPAPGGVRHTVFSKTPACGVGPDLVVLHEITGASEKFFAYTDELVSNGYTVHCPVLFGAPLIGDSKLRIPILTLQACHPGSEVHCFTPAHQSRLNPWLVALAADISGPLQKPIGAIGMCLTGIQPLAMLRCRSVVAAVLCQPTIPLNDDPISRRDLGLPPADVDFARMRVLNDRAVELLLLRFPHDPISSAERAQRLHDLFAPRIKYPTLEDVPEQTHEHSTLVGAANTQAKTAVLTLLNGVLKGPDACHA